MLLLPALAAACASAPPPRAWRCGGRGRPALLASGRLRLRGGRGEEGAAGFRGEVALPAGSRSLPHIVQHASGPLRIRCTGNCSWDDDARGRRPSQLSVTEWLFSGASFDTLCLPVRPCDGKAISGGGGGDVIVKKRMKTLSRS